MPDFSSDHLIALEAIKLYSGPSEARRVEQRIAKGVPANQLFGDDALAVLALEQALGSEAERFRRSASMALHTIAIREEAGVEARISALQALQKFDDPLAQDALHTLLLDKLPAVRASASKAAPRNPSKATIDLLGAQLADEFEDVAAASCNALRRIGQPAVYALIGALKFDKPQARLLAAEELGFMKAQEAIPALVQGIKTLTNEEKGHFMHALSILGGKDAERAILNELKSPHEELREQAARALSRFITYEAWAALLKLEITDDTYKVITAVKSSIVAIESQIGFLKRMQFSIRFFVFDRAPLV